MSCMTALIVRVVGVVVPRRGGGGVGLSRHPEFSAVSEAFFEQSINHLSSATVETFILDPG